MRASRINQNRSDPILLRNPDAGVLPEFPEGPCPEENFCLSYSYGSLLQRAAGISIFRKLGIIQEYIQKNRKYICRENSEDRTIFRKRIFLILRRSFAAMPLLILNTDQLLECRP